MVVSMRPVVAVFPDNTVLVNLAHVNRLDLLDPVLRTFKPKWTLSVSRECRKSSRIEGLEGLGVVGNLFGAPLVTSNREYVEARCIQNSMLKPGQDSSSAHMGEAETIAIICSRMEFENSLFLTDDHDAMSAARNAKTKTGRPIGTLSTHGVIAWAELYGYLSRMDAHNIIDDLIRLGRHSGPPSAADYDEYTNDRKRKRRVG